MGRLLLVGAAACSLSCDVLKPERSFNPEAQQPTFGALDPATIRPGQHLAGTVILGSSTYPVQSALVHTELYVDSTLAASGYAPTYLMSLDTQAWPQGPHQLTVMVYESEPNTGIYGAFGLPSMVLSSEVVFDQSPPTPVTLSSVVWDGGTRVLTWTPNADPNFFTYQIARSGNWGPFTSIFYVLPGTPIDDRAMLNYRDTTLSLVYGASYDYQVVVDNRAQQVASNTVNVRYGDRVPDLNDHLDSQPVTGPSADEFYVMDELGVLKAISTSTHSVVRTRTEYSDRSFALSPDGSRIYLTGAANGQDVLEVVEASTFGTLTRLPLSGLARTGEAMVVGRPDRLYVSRILGPIYVVDTGTGAIVTQIALGAERPKLAMSPDHNTLYAASDDSVYRIDISTDALQVLGRWGALHDIAYMQISPDGQRLYLGHVYGAPSNYVEILDAATFAPAGSVQAAPGEQHFNFLVTASCLYFSESLDRPDERYFLPGRVIQYDRNTLAPLRSWDFVQVPRWLAASRDEQVLYPLGFEAWIIPLTPPGPSLARR